MALKLFAKAPEVEVEVVSSPSQDARTQRLERQVEEMTLEMGRLKNEVDTMVARQQSFRLALLRLREYLEEKGIQERTAAEVKDDVTAPNSVQAAIARKDKSNMH